MTATFPESVISDGSVSVLWVPTLADQDEPTLAELNAGSVLDITCYLTDAGWQPNLTEDAATDNRLCSRQNFQKAGRQTYAMPLIYVSNPAEFHDLVEIPAVGAAVRAAADRRAASNRAV